MARILRIRLPKPRPNRSRLNLQLVRRSILLRPSRLKMQRAYGITLAPKVAKVAQGRQLLAQNVALLWCTTALTTIIQVRPRSHPLRLSRPLPPNQPLLRLLRNRLKTQKAYGTTLVPVVVQVVQGRLRLARNAVKRWRIIRLTTNSILRQKTLLTK